MSKQTGRPSSYNAELHPKLVYNLAVRGLTDIEIAREMGVSPDTLYVWSKKYPEFDESRKNGKNVPNEKVEAALFNSAVGVRHKQQKPMIVGGKVELIDYEEQLPPNPTSIIFYLKNRMPEKYSDKQQIEHSGEIEYRVVPAKRPDGNG